MTLRDLYRALSGRDRASASQESERPVVHVDVARLRETDGVVEVRGWIAGRSAIAGVRAGAKPGVELDLTERPDVVQALPHMAHVAGFEGEIDRAYLISGAVPIECRFSDGVERVLAPLARDLPRPRQTSPVELEIRAEERTTKLARIAAHLCCPACGGELDDDRARCLACGAVYEHGSGLFNFLTTAFREELSIVETENVSANQYDPTSFGIVDAFPDGLVLDCGAGRRTIEYRNVVNFEIVAYPSTDVVGVGEHLPFRDETFDAVLSLAVLEHVKDPFRCASEIARVLKPGGVLYCVVPFLQPVHGYPHHYYNMTSQGLRNLFDGLVEVVEQDVPLSGHPVWTLSWVLASWAAGLPDGEREAFLDLRVRDLAGDPLEYLDRAFVQSLPREKRFELASTTLLLGRKPEKN